MPVPDIRLPRVENIGLTAALFSKGVTVEVEAYQIREAVANLVAALGAVESAHNTLRGLVSQRRATIDQIVWDYLKSVGLAQCTLCLKLCPVGERKIYFLDKLENVTRGPGKSIGGSGYQKLHAVCVNCRENPPQSNDHTEVKRFVEVTRRDSDDPYWSWSESSIDRVSSAHLLDPTWTIPMVTAEIRQLIPNLPPAIELDFANVTSLTLVVGDKEFFLEGLKSAFRAQGAN